AGTRRFEALGVALTVTAVLSYFFTFVWAAALLVGLVAAVWLLRRVEPARGGADASIGSGGGGLGDPGRPVRGLLCSLPLLLEPRQPSDDVGVGAEPLKAQQQRGKLPRRNAIGLGVGGNGRELAGRAVQATTLGSLCQCDPQPGREVVTAPDQA